MQFSFLLSIIISTAMLAQYDNIKADEMPHASLAPARSDNNQSNDFGGLERYRDANFMLIEPAEVVFIGDSITKNWHDKMPQFFSRGRVGRGISGQTSMQMLLRFRQDVIDLKPQIVQIMAGTNDIAGNTGPMSPEQTEANIMSMAELAHAHGIKVILASIPPADHFPWKPGVNPAHNIAKINAWMRDYAKRIGATYADYWTALHDGQATRASFTKDGVHPNQAGYSAMAPIAEAAIRTAFGKPRPRPSAN